MMVGVSEDGTRVVVVVDKTAIYLTPEDARLYADLMSRAANHVDDDPY